MKASYLLSADDGALDQPLLYEHRVAPDVTNLERQDLFGDA
jgi:hypothetical protein